MPFGPSDTIRKSVNQLLAAQGGFVIFTSESGDFVQFALDPDGLSLFWPDVSRIEASRVTHLLENLGIAFDDADDGVYAKFGRDVDLAERFTLRAFRALFGEAPTKLDT